MKRLIAIVLVLSVSSYSHAGYNANFVGKITKVLTYPYSNEVLIRVEGQPTSHPTCTSLDYLSIAPDVTDAARQVVISRILMAYASGEAINIGYDKEGDCVSGRIRIHRVG